MESKKLILTFFMSNKAMITATIDPGQQNLFFCHLDYYSYVQGHKCCFANVF